MERHKLGTQAAGASGMKAICDLLEVGVDPRSVFLEYTQVVGDDLNAASIEAGLPRATWSWSAMPQSDFQYLLDFVGSAGSGNVYIRTCKNSGASGMDFANYLAVMKRPRAGGRNALNSLVCQDVTVEFVMLEVQP